MANKPRSVANEEMGAPGNDSYATRNTPPRSASRRDVLRFIPHWPLLLVCLIYVSLAAPHSLAVPLTAGNDEWAHFLYTRFIAEHGRLPATAAERNEAGYKSDAPPLYHMLVAGLTAWVEPSRLLRPLDSPRRRLADNIVDSYALLHTGSELPPYRGEVLLWHLGRGVSILFGLAVISLTYLTGLELFGRRRPAWLAAALLAFTPALVFHSSVLSYESLSAALAALFLLAAVKAIQQPHRRRGWLVLGGLAGLSITTKYSAILLPLEIIFIIWLAARRSPLLPPRFPLFALLPAALALLLAVSGWFGFVIWHFNTIDSQGPLLGVLQPLLVGDASDTTSVQVAAFLFGESQLEAEARPRLARNYGQMLQTLLDSFWAAPVAGQFVLSPWPALLFSGLALLGLAGLWPVWRRAGTADRTRLALLLFHSSLIIPLLLVRMLFSFDPREAVQGRHLLLPAASAIPLLLVWGWEQGSRRLAPAVTAGLLAWSLLGQLGWAVLAYPPPIPVWSGAIPAAAQTQPIDLALAGGAIRLTGFSWRQSPAAAALEVTLWWQALDTLPEDYLVELSLLDQAGRLAGYTLGHPVQGRYPSRAWEPGDVIKDMHWLPLSGAGAGDYRLQLRLLARSDRPAADNNRLDLAPVRLSPPSGQPAPLCQVWQQGQAVEGGLFSRSFRVRSTVTVLAADPPRLAADGSEQRPLVSVDDFHLFIVGPDWPAAYAVMLGDELCARLRFDVPPRNFSLPDIPHRLDVDFNRQIRLLGYDLPTRRIYASGRLPLTLYWQALDTMGEDYRMFDNLLDAGQRRWGGYDRLARDGYSTLQWVPGEVITDAFGVPIDPAAPNGIYTIDIGWYRAAASGAVPLPVTVEGQPLEQTGVRLGPIKVGGPPPDLVAARPAPQATLNQSFGSPAQITLLGYDLADDQGRPIQNSTLDAPHLALTLYWQAQAVPAADYTVFLHLRNRAEENAAQQDGPPGSGRYPTSLWDPGEIIVQNVSLPLADLPPGTYTPVLGLYDFTTGLRLPLDDGPATELRLEKVSLP
ncbi:MAG: glycosyltransferase family 39 protein [Chloroflexota bacterium]